MAEVDIYRHWVADRTDWEFVRPLVCHAPREMLPPIFSEYRRRWKQAAYAEPKPHRKENAGRRAANTGLRRDVEAMKRRDPEANKRYATMVRLGTPEQLCATCRHSTMVAGECKRAGGTPETEKLCTEFFPEVC